MVYFAKWKVVMVLAICVLGLVLSAPNFLTTEQAASIPTWLPHKQLRLGLDLQGGSHLLLEVDLKTVTRERLDNLVHSLRGILRGEKIGYRELGVEGETATFRVRDLADVDRAASMAKQAEAGTVVESDGSGKISVRYTEEAITERRNQVIAQSVEIVRRRIDEFGTSEPSIQRQGRDRIIVQLPGIDDPERVKRLLGQTAKMNFRLVDTTVSAAEIRARGGRPPPGSEILPSDDEIDPTTGRPVEYVVKKRIMVPGDNLVDSQPTVEQGRPVISFRFDITGARKFGQVTKKNVGRPFAIVLDGKVISAPIIREPIMGGSGIISGSFTTVEAKDLALLLRAGALPAPLTILEERTVGPDLGADSIRAGKIACIIGLILVLIFMVISYGIFGAMANVALLFNLALIAGALSLLQATLTLPGIAGIILTMGMAVDANVLIFERIREEVRAGRTPISAVDAGYRRALTTIIDANLTTLFAAIILFMFGTGPIQGFAVTLSIGLMTSMFTAIMLTRLMVVFWLRQHRAQVLPL